MRVLTGCKLLLLIFLLFPILRSPNASAANMRFLSDSVFSELNKEEIESLKNSVGDAMDEVPDRKVVYWKSESSTATGKFKTLFTHTMDDATCRRTVFSLAREHRQPELYQFDVCNRDGQWHLMETPAARFSNADWDLMTARVQEALRFDGEGRPFSWRNKTTGNSGVIVPMPVKQAGKKSCRELAISISDQAGQTSNGAYLFCRTSNNEWERVIEEP